MSEKDAAYWASPAEMPVEQVQAKIPTNKIEATQAFLRSMGRSASIGLTDYPAAAAMMGIRRLTGAGGAENTYENALRDVRAQTAQMAQQYPTSVTTGDITGMLLGGALTPVGKSAARLVATGAGTGAISGFTGREGMENVLEDVGQGATFGAGLSTIGGALGRLYAGPSEALVKNMFINRQQDVINNYAAKAAQNREDILPIIDKVRAYAKPERPTKAAEFLGKMRKKTDEDIINDIAKNKIKGTSISAEDVKTAQALQKNEAVIARANTRMTNVENKTGKELFDYTRGSLQYGAGQAIKDYVNLASGLAPQMALGAVGGAGLGLLSGMPPMHAAGIGAGLMGMYDLKARGGPVALKTLGATLAKTAPTGATPIAGSLAAARYFGASPESDYSAYEQYAEPQAPAEVPDTRTRLQRMADDFRNRNTGQQ